MNQEVESEERVIVQKGMSKRRLGQSSYCNCTGKRLRSVEKQKDLYLVLDDWAKGFTIHKINADNTDLSESSVLRLVTPKPLYSMDFAAVGSNILAVSNQHRGTLVYDTETAALASGPCLPDSMINNHTIFLASADVLYAFTYNCREEQHSFVMMSTATTKDSLLSSPSADWSWESATSPFCGKEMITSYALHPDGRTIFVSTHNTFNTFSYRPGRPARRTFSFDTRSHEWRCHGEWALPFNGEGYFDSDLDAWVGLHEDGYICSCQVASRSSTDTMEPDWKMAKEKLWSQKQVADGPTLTYMGNSRFCLVECLEREGVDFDNAFPDSDDDCMVQITMFGLKYNHKGELRMIGRTTNSYPVSKFFSEFALVAFCM